MSHKELNDLILKNDKIAIRSVFEKHYGKMAAIASRYCKNQTRASEAVNFGFNNYITKLQKNRNIQAINIDEEFEKEFIKSCTAFVKSFSSEYYVASTVYASGSSSKNFDLFESNEFIDFNLIDNDVLIKSLQQLVPSQRLVINLHVIDGNTLEETANIIEASLQTVKSSLEKARYNLQKNVEKCYKTMKNEQSL
ncbi:MAG: sigma factor-like helix-turn-helix DNA-binding protein [Bacteroidota bacterium]|nr:sigma factor-like helix-turn-helix DNA-binding protein [Bacteroidota bacterium]MDP3144375.1 sigma factor-like helix-turn-helix DNA-binding protein [Bacteroidota bacterium]